MRKHPLTLIEIVVGFSLTAILLGFLFNSFSHMVQSHIKVQKIAQEIHGRTFFQLRLNQLFYGLGQLQEKSDFHLEPYVDSLGTSLSFHFQNGIDHKKEFSGVVKATLYLNREHELRLLLTTPQNITREELLFKEIKNVTFEFFHPKEGWQSTWEEKATPTIVKIHVQQQANPLIFTFFVNQENLKVVYS